MKKSKIFLFVTIILIVFVTGANLGCSNQVKNEPDNQPKMSPQAESVDVRVERIVNKMSNAEKVGQLVMIGIQGKNVNDDDMFMLNQYHIGNVILFGRNIESEEQIKNLTRGLQKQRNDKMPLYIAIDEEGGMVSRLDEIRPAPPSQQEIGASGNVAEAENVAVKIAKELKGLGININFAPVADVGDIIDTRSFGSDAGLVSRFVDAAASGYEKEKVVFTLKHFPGIGKGVTDSHYDSVVVNASEEELTSNDLVPFADAITKHNNDNFMVMVTHVTFPAVGGDMPASISDKIITGILRNKLGFKGIIISDDLEMGAVAKYYNYSDLGTKAILAGADMVMMCHDYEHQREMYLGVLDAVEKGLISQERLNESVKRVIKSKIINLAEEMEKIGQN